MAVRKWGALNSLLDLLFLSPHVPSSCAEGTRTSLGSEALSFKVWDAHNGKVGYQS